MTRGKTIIGRLLRIAPVIIWTSVMFGFSGQPATESGELSMGLAQRVLELLPFLNIDAVSLEPILRKLAHFAIFAVEGFLLYVALTGIMAENPRKWLVATALCAPIAIADELHQLFAEERACQVKDMLLDVSGALAGAVCAAILFSVLRKLDRRRSV